MEPSRSNSHSELRHFSTIVTLENISSKFYSHFLYSVSWRQMWVQWFDVYDPFLFIFVYLLYYICLYL